MKQNTYWTIFEKTGNIEDYLHYACTSEESLQNGRESILSMCSGGKENNAGDHTGDGSFIHTRG